MSFDSFKYIISKLTFFKEHTSVSALSRKRYHTPQKCSMYSNFNKTLPQEIKRQLSKGTTHFNFTVLLGYIPSQAKISVCKWDHTQRSGLICFALLEHYYLNALGIKAAELVSRVLINRWLACSVAANQWFHSHQSPSSPTTFSFALAPICLPLLQQWRDCKMVIRWSFHKQAIHTVSMEKEWLMDCVLNDLFYY